MELSSFLSRALLPSDWSVRSFSSVRLFLSVRSFAAQSLFCKFFGDLGAAVVALAPIEPDRMREGLLRFVIPAILEAGESVTVPKSRALTPFKRRLAHEQHRLAVLPPAPRLLRLVERGLDRVVR